MDGSKAIGARTIRTGSGPRGHHTRAGRGFSLIDVLVSISVIAALIGLLLPSLGLVRETTRRVVCASNIRQLGLGVAMYAEDFQGAFPPSVFCPPAGSAAPQLHRTVVVRIGDDPAAWDGLGVLFASDYIPAPGVYYCPSHRGDIRLPEYLTRWQGRGGEIVSNFQYRARGPEGEPLTLFGRPPLAILSDSMRTAAEYNHRVGANVLRLDLRVGWVPTPGVVMQLPVNEADVQASQKVGNAWEDLDVAPIHN